LVIFAAKTRVMANLRSLGKTGIKVSPVGLGCWQFSKQNNIAGKFWPSVDDEVINEIVGVSLRGGINFFDTAEVYGNGASERSLSNALQKAGVKPGEVIIATKWWPVFRFASNIKKTIHERLNALKPYPIDLYQVHQPFGFSTEKGEMEAMAEIFESEHIRSIGVSNFSASKMKSAWKVLNKRSINLASNQVKYNLLDRKIESDGTLKAAKDLGISIIAYSPLAQGLLTGKFHDNPDLRQNLGMRKFTPAFTKKALEKSLPVVKLVKELAEKYNVSASQIALNWLVSFHGDAIIAIPGATKTVHANDNTGSMHFILSGEDMQKLDKVSSAFK
jgi:aryl-alcohol dehydrogenase-like predicted oxidoreductase